MAAATAAVAATAEEKEKEEEEEEEKGKEGEEEEDEEEAEEAEKEEEGNQNRIPGLGLNNTSSHPQAYPMGNSISFSISDAFCRTGRKMPPTYITHSPFPNNLAERK